jgi:cysteine-rich repeat protein
VGEECDDGNLVSGDGCSPGCRIQVCGNGRLEDGEECDDDNVASGDGCSQACEVEECGNGRTDFAEECDDGNRNDGDGCSPTCQFEVCGNGVLDSGEECDDANSDDGDGCDGNCTTTACGNGIQTAGEACDDGNRVAADGCGIDCDVDHGVQSKSQRRCIEQMNEGVGRIARARAKQNLRCLRAAAAGRVAELGVAPATFDACLDVDPGGRVAKSQTKLDRAMVNACFVNELPELALVDPLAGREPAASLLVQAVHALLGNPPEAIPGANREAARCQASTLRAAQESFESVWKAAVESKRGSLRGLGGEPARNDQQLGHDVTTGLLAVANDRSARLSRVIGKACIGVPGLEVVLPGCQPADVLDLACCSQRIMRCTICTLLRVSDPLLALTCDALDDEQPNGSCL